MCAWYCWFVLLWKVAGVGAGYVKCTGAWVCEFRSSCGKDTKQGLKWSETCGKVTKMVSSGLTGGRAPIERSNTGGTGTGLVGGHTGSQAGQLVSWDFCVGRLLRRWSSGPRSSAGRTAPPKRWCQVHPTHKRFNRGQKCGKRLMPGPDTGIEVRCSW